MKNSLIIGVIAIVAIGGFVLLQSSPTPPPPMDEPIAVEEVEVVTEPAVDEMPNPEESGPTIVETAVATPELSTLVTAVTQAELATVLQGEGPFTVFAPVNDAFAALPTETLESLLQPENIEDLQGVLTYHVVPGAVMSSDLTDGMVVNSVNGESLTINVNDAGVSINGSANVTTADIQTSNGVVHIIDSVLLPPAQ